MFRKRGALDAKPMCSFCGRGEDVAGKLIHSPRNDDLPPNPACYICADCVAVCKAIVDDASSVNDEAVISECDASPVERLSRSRATSITSSYSVRLGPLPCFHGYKGDDLSG
jgi:hypothetical protein